MVTNALRFNTELLLLRLTDFFTALIIGSMCDQAKPLPDPYRKALRTN
jgi:beta-phosphoglucomutase-like phosphatase (HAD superfamily)